MTQGLSLAAANALGNQVATWYAARLPAPHILEYEKVMSPLLLIMAKMYAGAVPVSFFASEDPP